MLDFIQTFFRELVAAFALLVVSGFVLWMVFVVIALFRELFNPGDIQIRSYLYRIWRLLLLSFELVAYGGIFVAMFLLKSAEEEKLRFTLMMIQAILFSVLFLYIRWKTGGFFFQQKQSRRSR
ncbi:hypothetical protein [Desmospora activa]|uniref:Uncharacterized protein n=1 Tax=Desmospora activa DSM 45169 TaxID=1121389 RepID=A0A2T4ZCR6_9BACL|nr:hypothetical protein [Desmospora activa]PTM59687.1 hypothetical protein C8J48_2317 [Desmospora activa DSM 45169]